MAGVGVLHLKYGSFVVESSLSNPLHKNNKMGKAIAAEATSAPERYAGASFFKPLHYPLKFGSFVVESFLSTSKNSVSSSNPLHKKEKAIAAEATSAPAPKRYAAKAPERYVGAAFFTSPPPTSLPVPAFLTKNAAAGNNLTKNAAEGNNHDSTSALSSPPSSLPFTKKAVGNNDDVTTHLICCGSDPEAPSLISPLTLRHDLITNYIERNEEYSPEYIAYTFRNICRQAADDPLAPALATSGQEWYRPNIAGAALSAWNGQVVASSDRSLILPKSRPERRKPFIYISLTESNNFAEITSLSLSLLSDEAYDEIKDSRLNLYFYIGKLFGAF
nr:hypothetical protein Iba_chr01dCG4430 [Ipomoea batatas]